MLILALLLAAVSVQGVWVAQLKDGSDVAQFAQRHGIVRIRDMRLPPTFYAFDKAPPLSALRSEDGVEWAEEQVPVRRYKRAEPTDVYYRNQWHLHRNHSSSVKAPDAWDLNRTGQGVVIGVVDDGLQHTHSELQARHAAEHSYDYNNNDNDPSPGADDPHGTSAAGVAVASQNNGHCGSGVAPNARVAGLRLISAPATDATESMALTHHGDRVHIYSNSWGPMDDARNLGGMGAITRAALANAAATGRGGKGSIYVWAAGNGRAEGDRADYDAYASSPYTIAVGAIDHRGDQSYYSESGACLCCVAPSSGAGKGITTADLSGPGQGYDGNSECTSDFGGTSSAAPLAAGVIALVLEERPALTWRDVQGVLAVSCKRIHTEDAAGWSKSATPHHHDFGWGLVDAGKAVLTARNWTMWPRQKGFVSGRVNVNKSIPAAGQALCYEHTFPATASSIHFVEHVLLQVGISTAQRGKLNLFLRSPANETSVFMTPHDADTHANVPNTWTFMSLHHCKYAYHF